MTDVYEHSAEAYDLLQATRGKDYGQEATTLTECIRSRRPGARTLLDVACGSGLHLAGLVAGGWEVEGLDLSEDMLAAARSRLPGVPLHAADMRTFRLGRRFDAVVCLYSAIGYMTTLDDLSAAVTNMLDHLVAGGVLVVEPWFEPEDWLEGYVHAEAGQANGLAVGRVSRSWREGDLSVIEMRYVMARHDRTWSFTEVHRMGLFPLDQQLDVYRSAGLTVEHLDPGLTGRGLIAAVKSV